MNVANVGKIAVAISAGESHNVALYSDGTVYAWGNGTYGQLGNNNTINLSAPVPVNTSGVLSGKTVVAIAAGSLHTVALCSDGTSPLGDRIVPANWAITATPTPTAACPWR